MAKTEKYFLALKYFRNAHKYAQKEHRKFKLSGLSNVSVNNPKEFWLERKRRQNGRQK